MNNLIHNTLKWNESKYLWASRDKETNTVDTIV